MAVECFHISEHAVKSRVAGEVLLHHAAQVLLFGHKARPAVMLLENFGEATVAQHHPVVEQKQLRVNLLSQ